MPKKKQKKKSAGKKGPVATSSPLEALEEIAESESEEARATEGEPEEEMVSVKQSEWNNVQASLKEYECDRLRFQAEIANIRKRTAKEIAQFAGYAAEKVAMELLPVLDNFDRAMDPEHAKNEEAFREGIEMIHKQIFEALAKANIVPQESVGEEFDPEKHEALMHASSTDFPENVVAFEIEKGYMLNDKLIRPAKVSVSSGPPENDDSNG
ncbi:nucleotide exchange factor GrpE [Candidatus Hydrogenedentota bacterium]